MSESEIVEAVERLKEGRAEQPPEQIPEVSSPPAVEDDGPQNTAEFWKERLEESGTVDDALEVLAANREAAQTEGAEEPAAEVEPAPSTDEAPDEPAHDDTPIWSTEDLALRDTMEKARDVLHDDMIALALKFGGNAEQLSKADFRHLADSVVGVLDALAATDPATLGDGDKGRGMAARLQAKEAAAEIRERFNSVAEATNQFAEKAKSHEIQAEKAKLLKAMPDFDARSTAKYLVGHRFTAEDLASVRDHRLLLIAEKARRWDELQATQKGKKVPVMRKGAKPKPKVSPQLQADYDRAARSGDTREIARLYPLMPKRSKEPQTAADAKAQLKRTGSVNDAVELLKLRRKA